jgi:hypothetical protein
MITKTMITKIAITKITIIDEDVIEIAPLVHPVSGLW